MHVPATRTWFRFYILLAKWSLPSLQHIKKRESSVVSLVSATSALLVLSQDPVPAAAQPDHCRGTAHLCHAVRRSGSLEALCSSLRSSSQAHSDLAPLSPARSQSFVGSLAGLLHCPAEGSSPFQAFILPGSANPICQPEACSPQSSLLLRLLQLLINQIVHD